MSRFELSKFRDPPDEELICGICMNVLDSPLETPCRHVFCRECINSSLDRKRKCPLCRARCKKRQLKDVLPLVQNLINKLPMKCDNYENGCIESIQKEYFLDHVKSCEYVMVSCCHKECKQHLLKKDIEDHQKNKCTYRDQQCDKGCDQMITWADRETHNCMKTLLALVTDLTERNRSLEGRVAELNSVVQGLTSKPEGQRSSTVNDNKSLGFLLGYTASSANWDTDSDDGSPRSHAPALGQVSPYIEGDRLNIFRRYSPVAPASTSSPDWETLSHASNTSSDYGESLYERSSEQEAALEEEGNRVIRSFLDTVDAEQNATNDGNRFRSRHHVQNVHDRHGDTDAYSDSHYATYQPDHDVSSSQRGESSSSQRLESQFSGDVVPPSDTAGTSSRPKLEFLSLPGGYSDSEETWEERYNAAIQAGALPVPKSLAAPLTGLDDTRVGTKRPFPISNIYKRHYKQMLLEWEESEKRKRARVDETSGEPSQGGTFSPFSASSTVTSTTSETRAKKHPLGHKNATHGMKTGSQGNTSSQEATSPHVPVIYIDSPPHDGDSYDSHIPGRTSYDLHASSNDRHASGNDRHASINERGTDTRQPEERPNALPPANMPVTRRSARLQGKELYTGGPAIPDVRIPPSAAFLLQAYGNDDDDSSEDGSWSPSHAMETE